MPGPSTIPPAIAAAYDPDQFRAHGHRLIDAIADQLARWHARDGAVVPWQAPETARAGWAAEPLAGGADLVDDLRRVMAASTALAHPRFLAHQVAPPLPGAALAELVAALLNNGMAVYEMGPAATPIELSVIAWMCGKLGLPAGAGGVLTSGGSLGNLTALLAMRQAGAGFDVWRAGAHAGPPLAVITSAEAHYSVARTLGIMGWGEGGAIAAPVDAQHRLVPAGVDAAVREARAAGKRLVGIIAAAGSTATGAFDPLEALADVAGQHGVWLHVDAAHGGGLALSRAHRGKLAGIERADSIVWDAHKLLMMPALVTAVLFKRGGNAYDAFAQQASYLFAGAAREHTWWDLGQRTLECTKRAMAIELWTTLRTHGEPLLAEIIDRLIALAGELAARVAAAPDFELALAPEANIVCYRHRPAGSAPGAALDAHNRALRQRVLEAGKFYVVGTQLADGYYLRSTIMNALTEPHDFDALLQHVRELCPA